MGQKVNPNGLRLGINCQHNSLWLSDKKSFSNILYEDIQIRQYICNKFKEHSIVSKILIERTKYNIKIIINTAKPGVIIGKKGGGIAQLRDELKKKYKPNVVVTVGEIYNSDLDASLVAQYMSSQLKKNIMFRKIIKKSIANAMENGALGIKISFSGRLAGSDIARTEWHMKGKVPLHTLKANIDYHFLASKTSFGIIGIKVWIFKKQII